MVISWQGLAIIVFNELPGFCNCSQKNSGRSLNFLLLMVNSDKTYIANLFLENMNPRLIRRSSGNASTNKRADLTHTDTESQHFMLRIILGLTFPVIRV